MPDESSAHEKAAVALRFKQARRKYLRIMYKVEEYSDMGTSEWFSNGQVQTSWRIREYHAFMAYTKSREAEDYDRECLMLCHGYMENPIAEAYANGKVRPNTITGSGSLVLSWRFPEPHEL